MGGGAEGMMFAAGVDPALAQVGIGYGQRLLGSGGAMLQGYAGRMGLSTTGVRSYFDVTHKYVGAKLRRLLFPFLVTRNTQAWTRQVSGAFGGAGTTTFKTPRDDVMAPDLYIPLMAYITYALLGGVKAAIEDAQSFSPEIVALSASRALALLVLEVLGLKAALYFASTSRASITLPWLDLLSTCGYLFVGVCVNCVGGIFAGRGVYYVLLPYTASMIVYFTVRSLKSALKLARQQASSDMTLEPSGFGGPAPSVPQSTLVIGIALLQYPIAWMLGMYIASPDVPVPPVRP